MTNCCALLPPIVCARPLALNPRVPCGTVPQGVPFPSDVTSPDRLSLIRNTFSVAVDLPTGERKAFLEETCGSDGDLRCGADSLLAAIEPTRGQWDQPAAAVQAAVPSTGGDGTRWPIDPGSGLNSVVGAYSLVRLLGEGGMGAVY